MKWDEDFKQSMILFFIAGPGCILFIPIFGEFVVEFFLHGKFVLNAKTFPFLVLIYFFLLGLILDYKRPLSIVINVILIIIWFLITNGYALYIPMYYIWGIYTRKICNEQKWL